MAHAHASHPMRTYFHSSFVQLFIAHSSLHCIFTSGVTYITHYGESFDQKSVSRGILARETDCVFLLFLFYSAESYARSRSYFADRAKEKRRRRKSVRKKN